MHTPPIVFVITTKRTSLPLLAHEKVSKGRDVLFLFDCLKGVRMSSFDRLIRMVEKKNTPTFPLTPETVLFESPVIEDAADHNTRVTMRARGAGHGYTGQVDLFYTRVNLGVLAPLNLSQELPFKLTDVLRMINEATGSELGMEDITNTTDPNIPTGVPTSFVLSARSDSLVWLGNVQVTLLTGMPTTAFSLDDDLVALALPMI